MALHHAATDDKSKTLRKQGGLVLKTLRTTNGFTQKELAKRAGLEYYTFISQIEAGTGRIPPQKYKAFADAFNVDVKKFVRELLKFYDPDTFEVLFDASRDEPTDYEGLRK